MKTVLRVAIAVAVGIAVMLFGQLAIENIAWWWTGVTTTFDDPLLNAMKFGGAAAAGFGLALAIGMEPRHRRRLL